VVQTDPVKSDADLVGEALCGIREALAELVRRHWDTAVFLTARVLGSQELARDAAQEAAVAALTDLGRLRSPDRFGAWYCGIALNVSRRWLRHLRPEVPGELADRAAASPGPAEAAESADVAARVRGAVAALPNGQQDAVLLFYLQGMSHREVAGELGISVGAVKSRLHQARAALAPVLAPIAEREPAGPTGRERATMNRVMVGASTVGASTVGASTVGASTVGASTVGASTVGASTVRENTVRENTVGWVDVTVSEIRREENEDPGQRKHVMILAERGGDRLLPVWIGRAEATAIALALEAVETPRPFTYKLAAGLVGAAGGRLAEVRIARLLDEVFYATVVVDGPAGQQEVDARPSDAVNLALAAGTPIRVDGELLSLDLPASHAEELSALPVATAEIAEEARRHITAWSTQERPD
jgi:RNA polymerase sigma factor (sigma-70 family)